MTNPSSWTTAVLADVVTGVEYGTSAPTVTGGTRPVVGMRQLNGGFVSLDGLSCVDGDLQDWSKLELKAGDLLFNRTNSPDLVGKVGIVRDDSPAVFASYLVRLSPDRGVVDPYFLNYWLNGPVARRAIRRMATRGVSQANINPTVLTRRCPVLLPSLPEQERIARLLLSWDEAIELTSLVRERYRETLAAFAADLFGPVHHSTQRPANWSDYRLGELFDERIQFGVEADPLLSVSQTAGVVLQSSGGRRDTSPRDKGRYKLALPGDLAYNTMRMWQGAVGLVPERGLVSPAYTVVTPRTKVVDPAYAAQLFKSKRMMFDFERYSQGLTSDTWSLKYPAFARIPVALPPLHEQEVAAAQLADMSRSLDLLDRQRAALVDQKRGLMQKLLTGELRVGKGKDL